MSPNPRRIRVLLADDHGVVRQGFRLLLSRYPDIEVVGEAASGREAVELCGQLHPDVVIKDLQTQTKTALNEIGKAKPLPVAGPVEFKIKVDTPTRADVAMSIPGVKRIDGFTVSYQAKDMTEAYKLIRVIYKYISW